MHDTALRRALVRAFEAMQKCRGFTALGRHAEARAELDAGIDKAREALAMKPHAPEQVEAGKCWTCGFEDTHSSHAC